MSRYRFIAAERGHYPEHLAEPPHGVVASGYCAWQTG